MGLSGGYLGAILRTKRTQDSLKSCFSYRKLRYIMHFAPRSRQDALLWHVEVILRRSVFCIVIFSIIGTPKKPQTPNTLRLKIPPTCHKRASWSHLGAKSIIYRILRYAWHLLKRRVRFSIVFCDTLCTPTKFISVIFILKKENPLPKHSHRNGSH